MNLTQETNHNYQTKPFVYLETLPSKGRKGIFFFLLVSIIIFLMPLVAIIFLVNQGEDIGFGFFITTLISSFVSFYLFKFFLWNKYGKEIFTIKDNTFTYYYDYKIFKDHYKQVEFNSIRIYPSKDETSDSGNAIVFELDNQDIVISLRKIDNKTIYKIKGSLNL